jgi:succinate dehydrogenase/fumarate reductase cytochrome b subunit
LRTKDVPTASGSWAGWRVGGGGSNGTSTPCILAYFLLHIFVTSSRAFGESAWTSSMARVTGPLFKAGEFLVFAAFAFHAVNGVRLVLVELGFAIGKPIEPVYPYRTSVNEQRPLAIGVMILAAILTIAGGIGFLE